MTAEDCDCHERWQSEMRSRGQRLSRRRKRLGAARGDREKARSDARSSERTFRLKSFPRSFPVSTSGVSGRTVTTSIVIKKPCLRNRTATYEYAVTIARLT